MARFDKIAVLAKMGETGMVPVFYHKDAEVAKKVVKACYDGGVRAFEFTNRGDFAHEVFEEVVKFAAVECPEMALGVGSPNSNKEVVEEYWKQHGYADFKIEDFEIDDVLYSDEISSEDFIQKLINKTPNIYGL